MNEMIKSADFQLITGKAIEVWKSEVDPLLAEISLFQACSAEPIFHALNAIRSCQVHIESKHIPNLQEWHSYYKNHNKLFDHLIPHISNVFSWGSDKRHFSHKEILTEKGPIPKGSGVEGLIDAIIPTHDVDLDWDTMPTAVLFTILVWMPCNTLFGENPPTLLHRARHGDTKAARSLIQLDKSILGEAGLARRIQRWQFEGRTDKIAELGSYLGESIPEISLQQVKLTWARFIQDSSIRDSNKLSAPKIQALFDAIAQDSGNGIQDPDIGDMSPEAFAKALNRRKAFWQLSPSQ